MTREETYKRHRLWVEAWRNAPRGGKLQAIDKIAAKYKVTRTAVQVAIAKMIKKNNLKIEENEN